MSQNRAHEIAATILVCNAMLPTIMYVEKELYPHFPELYGWPPANGTPCKLCNNLLIVFYDGHVEIDPYVFLYSLGFLWSRKNVSSKTAYKTHYSVCTCVSGSLMFAGEIFPPFYSLTTTIGRRKVYRRSRADLAGSLTLATRRPRSSPARTNPLLIFTRSTVEWTVAIRCLRIK